MFSQNVYFFLACVLCWFIIGFPFLTYNDDDDDDADDDDDDDDDNNYDKYNTNNIILILAVVSGPVLRFPGLKTQQSEFNS